MRSAIGQGGIVGLLVLAGAILAPAGLARAESRAELERDARTLQATHDATERESAQALEGLMAGVKRDTEARRRALEQQLRTWTEDPRDATLADINRQVQEALPIAQANGLDVARLTRIYELTKRVIRTADFPSPRETEPILGSTLAQRVAETLSWAIGVEDGLAEAAARHQEYRVGLYKRALLAYGRALLAAPSPPPPGCTPSAGQPTTVRNRQVPLVGCPDPVVAELRRYLDAVRTIQSADGDALAAEAEALIAEQQLVADVAAGIPVLGDAMDIYAVWAGEDLAGTPMTAGVRAFSALMILVPNVGPDISEQVMKRSPAARAAGETLAGYLAAVKETAGVIVDVYVKETRALAGDMAQGIARRWNATVDALDELAQSLRSSRRNVQALTDAERDQLRIYQNLRAAAQDQIDLADLPPAYRKRAADGAANRAAYSLGRAQAATLAERIAMSGLVGKHAGVFADVARETGQILIVRPVNRSATGLIELGWATKNMGVKLKSADLGAIAGAIPVNQSLNKTGTALRQAEETLAARIRAGARQAELDELGASVKKLRESLDKGNQELAKCFKQTPPCALQIPHPSGVMEAADAAGKPVFLLPDGKGGWIDVETDLPFQPGKAPEPVLILGDPATGRPLTADYDLLATADQGKLTTPRHNPDTGFITETQKKTVNDINDRVRKKAEAAGAEGANVVHHGPEQNFPGSPGVDYPLTAFEPSGEVMTIPRCDEACMRHWCDKSGFCDPDMVPGMIRVDPDRLAKDYFFDKRAKGFNLYPNPAWGWGHFNGLSGWMPAGGALPSRRP